MIDVLIPPPPSVNVLYFNIPRRGRVRTAHYRTWLEEAGWELARQRPPAILGRYHVTIELPRLPANADPDNRIKAILDLFVQHRLIEGDTRKHHAGLHLKPEFRDDGRVRVIIVPVIIAPVASSSVHTQKTEDTHATSRTEPRRPGEPVDR